MRAATRLLALALAGASLAVAGGASWNATTSNDLYEALVGQLALSEELDAHVEAARRHNAGKEEVITELGDGRLTLAEAAGRFERLDARLQEDLGLPPPAGGRAEAVGLVIKWADVRLPAEAVARLEQERARLEASDRTTAP
jgi:hypothetical protein